MSWHRQLAAHIVCWMHVGDSVECDAWPTDHSFLSTGAFALNPSCSLSSSSNRDALLFASTQTHQVNSCLLWVKSYHMSVMVWFHVRWSLEDRLFLAVSDDYIDGIERRGEAEDPTMDKIPVLHWNFYRAQTHTHILKRTSTHSSKAGEITSPEFIHKIHLHCINLIIDADFCLLK